jgi:hypothetical protein
MAKRAFTLIELLLYISLMVIILNVGIYFVWQIIGSKTKNFAYIEVEKNILLSLEKISYEAKKAKSLSVPSSLGQKTSELVLIKPDNSTIRFYLIDGALWINDALLLPLTNQRVKISELSFLRLEPVVPGVFQVRIKMNYINPDQRKEYQAEVETQKTISLKDNNE